MNEGLPGLSLEEIGKIMHESWSATKRAQGFHGPGEACPHETIQVPCEKLHADLIPWEQLPEKQKDINRHAFDALLPRIKQLISDERETSFQKIVEVLKEQWPWFKFEVEALHYYFCQKTP